MPVEIQIRTSIQHAWAELSEKFSDLEPGVKYGGGPPEIRKALDQLSDHIRNEEDLEDRLRISREADTGASRQVRHDEMEDELRRRKLRLHELCRNFIITLERLKAKP